MSAEHLDVLTDYVHRLPKIEALATTLVQSLDAQDRPFVFSLFGDHLPAMFDLFDAIGFRDDKLFWGNPLNETPYFVRSNVGHAESVERNVDVSFLASLVLDAAGLAGGEFFDMSSAYREFCGGSFQSCRAGDEYRDAYVQILYDFSETRWTPIVPAASSPRQRSRQPTVSMMSSRRAASSLAAVWSSPNARGMWSVAPSAYVSLTVEDPGDDDLVFAARIRNSESVSRADLRVNGRTLDTWEFDGPMSPHTRTVVIPAEIVPSDGTLQHRDHHSRSRVV